MSLWIRVDGEFHSSGDVSVGRRGRALTADGDGVEFETLCGETLALDRVSTWSEETPIGKTAAPSCPDCLDADDGGGSR